MDTLNERYIGDLADLYMCCFQHIEFEFASGW